MTDKVYNVLFLCTGNSARSILAECILNREGLGRFKGFSAGSLPKGEVHPFALELLRNQNYPTAGLRSKNFAIGESAPSGCSSSILVLGKDTKTTVTPCSGWSRGSETSAPKTPRYWAQAAVKSGTAMAT